MTYTVEYKEAILGLLDKAGVSYTFIYGKHKLVEFHGTDGRRYRRPVGITASDHRSVLNARAAMRRLLRSAGYQI